MKSIKQTRLTEEEKAELISILTRETGKVDDEGLLPILIRLNSGKFVSDTVARVKEMLAKI